MRVFLWARYPCKPRTLHLKVAARGFMFWDIAQEGLVPPSGGRDHMCVVKKLTTCMWSI